MMRAGHTMKTIRNMTRRRGFAVILTALLMVWVIPMVGLVIDAGVMYSIKARMTAACDAAALSAARSLSAGISLADQEAAARTRAASYYRANFPAGTMETANGAVQVVVAETAARVRTVTVSASAAAPVYFMQMLGSSRTIVNAVAQASRRDVNAMLVIDRSGSLEDAGACDDLEEAAIPFVNLFANGRDRLGLLTFGGSYRVDYPPTVNFKQDPKLTDEIDKLAPGGCHGWTGSAQALWKGYEEIVKTAQPGALNVLVFFTDGQPNTVTAAWPVKTQADAAGPVSRCWDWAKDVPSSDPAWNPVNQTYTGFISSSGTGRDGIRIPLAPAMPVGDDPGKVEIPDGFSGAAKPAGNDCYYRQSGADVDKDVPYYPDRDRYGNRMNTGYKPVEVHAGGPYAGRIRTDDALSMQNAAINAVDDAAQRIRNKELNASIPVVVYVVGLGGAGAAEHELLKRIANTKDSTAFDDNAPEGMYVYAPSPAQLGQSFQKIASEVLRLSK